MSGWTSGWVDTAGESFGLWDGDGEECGICEMGRCEIVLSGVEETRIWGDGWRGALAGACP